MQDFKQEFIDWLRGNGVGPARPAEIVADDRIRRYQVEGDRPGSKNAAYRLGLFGDYAMGWAKSHKHNDRALTWRSKGGATRLTAEERRRQEAMIAERKRQERQARIDARINAADAARAEWAAAQPPDKPHPYAVRKGIERAGYRVHDGHIIVPLYDEAGRLWNVQRIDRRGGKKFMFEGRIKGLYHPIGKRPMFKDAPFIFCEGWATGWTIHFVTGAPVVCAMTAGNLHLVAAAFRRKYRFARFVFAADNDCWTPAAAARAQAEADLYEGEDLRTLPGDDARWEVWRRCGWLHNAGLAASAAAAKLTGGAVVAAPEIWARHPARPTDFNDIQAIDPAAVRAAFKAFL